MHSLSVRFPAHNRQRSAHGGIASKEFRGSVDCLSTANESPEQKQITKRRCKWQWTFPLLRWAPGCRWTSWESIQLCFWFFHSGVFLAKNNFHALAVVGVCVEDSSATSNRALITNGASAAARHSHGPSCNVQVSTHSKPQARQSVSLQLQGLTLLSNCSMGNAVNWGQGGSIFARYSLLCPVAIASLCL